MKLADLDPARTLPILKSVASSIEDLLLGGLTTASPETARALELAFQEAARAKLFRLGICLRAAREELLRFSASQAEFSSRRLHANLTRAWLLAGTIAQALEAKDGARLERLSSCGAETRCARLEVVALGVIARPLPDSRYGFDFRLRVTAPPGDKNLPNDSLSWSYVTPLTASGDVPAEALLLVSQKQGFTPATFLEKRRVVIENCAIVARAFETARIVMSEKTKVKAGSVFDRWPSLVGWTPDKALERLRGYRPSPLDLEVELQEEIFLDQWALEGSRDEPAGRTVFSLKYRGLVLETGALPEGQSRVFRDVLKQHDGGGKGSGCAPLFGVMHYERCRLVFQPVALIGAEGPLPLLLDLAKLDPKLLLKAFKFK